MSANPIATFPKDPNELLDYVFDWAQFLQGDTIASVAWAGFVGITKASEMVSPTSVTVWIAGGTLGTNYVISLTVTTTGARVFERSIQINVVDR